MKKTKEKKEGKSVKVIWLTFLILILIGGVFCFKWWLTKNKDYFEVLPRVKNVQEYEAPPIHEFKTIGWIRVQGTSLDLPILYSMSGNYDITPEYGQYAWSINEKGEFRNTMEVLGHNIFNLSSTPELKSELFERFEELMSFIYYDFAKENKYIQLTLGEEEYIYKIFAVELVPTIDTVYFPYHDEFTEEEMEQQIEYFKKNSFYDYDIDVNKSDKILSLITCTRFYGLEENVSFYVTGRLLREGERMTNYKVTKNDNYKKIEEILKGDDENEEA